MNDDVLSLHLFVVIMAAVGVELVRMAVQTLAMWPRFLLIAMLGGLGCIGAFVIVAGIIVGTFVIGLVGTVMDERRQAGG